MMVVSGGRSWWWLPPSAILLLVLSGCATASIWTRPIQIERYEVYRQETVDLCYRIQERPDGVVVVAADGRAMLFHQIAAQRLKSITISEWQHGDVVITAADDLGFSAAGFPVAEVIGEARPVTVRTHLRWSREKWFTGSENQVVAVRVLMTPLGVVCDGVMIATVVGTAPAGMVLGASLLR